MISALILPTLTSCGNLVELKHILIRHISVETTSVTECGTVTDVPGDRVGESHNLIIHRPSPWTQTYGVHRAQKMRKSRGNHAGTGARRWRPI